MPRAIPFIAPLLLSLAVLACSGPTTTPTSVSLVPQAAAPGSSAERPSVQAPTPPATEPLAATAAVTGTEAAAEETARAEPISAVTETVTYEDKEVGYAIDYPATWSIDAAPGSMVLLTSADLEAPNGGGISPTDAKINIVPDLAQVKSTLDELVAQSRQTGEVTSQEEIQLSGGVPAVLLRVTSPALGGNIRLLVTVINGRGVRVQGYGDLTLFDPIALSLRPLAATSP